MCHLLYCIVIIVLGGSSFFFFFFHRLSERLAEIHVSLTCEDWLSCGRRWCRENAAACWRAWTRTHDTLSLTCTTASNQTFHFAETFHACTFADSTSNSEWCHNTCTLLRAPASDGQTRDVFTGYCNICCACNTINLSWAVHRCASASGQRSVGGLYISLFARQQERGWYISIGLSITKQLMMSDEWLWLEYQPTAVGSKATKTMNACIQFYSFIKSCLDI